MLRKLSSAISGRGLRRYIKVAQLPIVTDMNVHQSGTAANKVYSQFAAPKINNNVAVQHPMTPKQIPQAPAPSTFRRLGIIDNIPTIMN